MKQERRKGMKTNGLDFEVSPTLCFKICITNFFTSGSYDCYPNISSVYFNKDIVSVFRFLRNS